MKKIQVEKTYFVNELGTAENPQDKTVWLVCHGYGQRTEFFKKKFDALNLNENYIILPEAGNYYYQQGFSGRVAANWMTSHQRLDAIQDINAYLNAVYQTFNLTRFKKVVLFGFSQGSYSIVRWMIDYNVPCDAVVLWGARIAEDYLSQYIERKAKYKLFMVIGKQDELIPYKLVEDHLAQYEKKNIPLEHICFEGKHDVYPEPLLELASKI